MWVAVASSAASDSQSRGLNAWWTSRSRAVAVLSGRIVDADGEPVAGIEVMALYRESMNQRSPQWSQIGGDLATDDRGDFRIYGLATGDYIVAAKPPESPAANRRPRPEEGHYDSHLLPWHTDRRRSTALQPRTFGGVPRPGVLAPGSRAISIRGRVLLPGGQVTESFAVLVPVNAEGDGQMGNERLAETRPDGTFTFSGVPAGNYRLTVRLLGAPGEERVGELDITAGQDDLTDLVVPTFGPTVIRGRVIVTHRSRQAQSAWAHLN